jgi:hypothetical protein
MAHIHYGSMRGGNGLRSDSPLSNDQIARVAPSVFAQEAHQSRGERYAFIPTSNVLDGLRAEGFEPFEARQTKVKDAGRREHTKHMLRLRHASMISARGAEVPEIILINSHDGLSSYQLMGGVFRMVCSNGLIAGDVADDIRIRHSGNVVGDVIEGSYRVLDNLKAIGERVEEYKATPLTGEEQVAFAHGAMVLKYGEETPIAAPQLLVARRYDDRGDDAWRTFNRVQESVIRGGNRSVSANGRRGRTRAVTSIGEDVRLNKALWAMMDHLVASKH